MALTMDVALDDAMVVAFARVPALQLECLDLEASELRAAAAGASAAPRATGPDTPASR
jgi:hypothetical protein